MESVNELNSTRGSSRVPMSKTIFWDFRIFRINQVNSVAGVGPGVDEVFAGKGFANIFGCAGVVDDRVAVLGKADADDEMAVGAGAFAAKAIVTEGKAHGDTAGDPILEFGDVAEPRDIPAHAAVRTGVGGIERPVAGAVPIGIENRVGDLGH